MTVSLVKRCACTPRYLCGECAARGYTSSLAGYAARIYPRPVTAAEVPNPGVTRCPCCGDDHYGPVQLCEECRGASCEQTRDASGELGYWACQREDDEGLSLEDGYDWDSLDGYDRSGVHDGRGHVYSDADPGL